MSADKVLADLTSRDAQRIRAASHDVARSWDLDLLRTLACEGWAIEAATRGIELGGALRSNRAVLDFALKKLRHMATSDACLCTLYPAYDMFDPAAEEKAGRLAIISEKAIPYASVFTCRCAGCGATYTAEERDYHYMWWQWSPLK
jgi:hypothetical protein